MAHVRKEPLLYILAFAMDAVFALVGLCVPLLAISLGATYDDLGALGAVGALVYTIACVLSGRLADRIGYRVALSVSSLGVVLVFLTYTAVSSVGQIFLVVAASRLVLAGFWPPTQAWLGQDKHGRDLLRTLGNFNVCWSLGIFAGPAVGGTLFGMDPDWPFLVASLGAAAVFAAITFARLSPENGGTATPRPPAHPDANRFRQIAWAANFATFFAGGAVWFLFPKLASDLGIASGPLGRLMAVVGLAQLVTFYIVSRSDRWQFRLLPLITVQLIGVLGLISLAMGNGIYPFAFGLATQGLLTGATFTASIFYALYSGGASGRKTGIHEAIIGSGHLFGPLLGGLAAENLGPRAPYALSAAVVLSAILVQVWILYRKPARALSPQASD